MGRSARNPSDDASRKYEPLRKAKPGAQPLPAEALVAVPKAVVPGWGGGEYVFIHFCSGPRRAGDLSEAVEQEAHNYALPVFVLALDPLIDSDHDLLKESLTENFTYGLERVDPEFIVDIATAMYDAVATDLDNLASDGAAEEDGGSGDVGGEDEFSQPSIQPDPALVPGTGDVEHRLLVERQRQEEDLRHINRILGAKVLWGKPFRRTVVEEASPAAGSSTRPERFVSPRARRGIQRRRQQESGVCSIQ